VNIAAQTRKLLESLQEPALAPFLADWPRTSRQTSHHRLAFAGVAVAAGIARDAAPFGIELVAAVHRAAPSLAWRQTYTAKDLDRAFLDNYGWSEILGGGNGALASERIACGFLILGPSTHYPRHRHEAEEIYLPLSGTAAWQQGDARWQDRAPGALIHHASEEPHAMRTGGSPLLALYLWRSDNLAQKARLDGVAT